MANQELRCVKCGKSFIFSEGEQAFYKEKHFDDPKRRQGFMRIFTKSMKMRK